MSFSNSNSQIVLGKFPWYEMLWRSMRGDFKPISPPDGGYEQFAKDWSKEVDHEFIGLKSVLPRLTWFGHVTSLLQVGGLNILTDPTLATHAGPLGKLGAKRLVPAVIQPEELPEIDVVLISHNHYDHLCSSTILKLIQDGQNPIFVVPKHLGKWFANMGIEKVIELDLWESYKPTDKISIHFTPSQHWSRRGLFDTNKTLWGGFMVVHDSKKGPWKFFYPGDTGYSQDFKKIREVI